MPKWFQEWFGWGTIKWRRANIVMKTSYWQRASHVIWGGKLYNLRENIDAVVNPPVVSTLINSEDISWFSIHQLLYS